MSTHAICPVEWGEISTKQSVGKCKYIIQIYSGITCGRVLNGELYTYKLYKLINLST